MKTLGLVGGAGWRSSLEYYRLLNEEVERRLGGHEAARLILHSFNFGDIMRAKAGDPEQHQVRAMVVDAARRLTAAGAEGLVLCANTFHWFADDVEQATPVPLVHIARVAGARIRGDGRGCVGLLGTRPTMERDFYRRHLEEAGLTVLVPDEPDREFVHQAILEELVRGLFRDDTRRRFLEIIEELGKQGAQGVVLGCTEIPLLVQPGDSPLPLYDTIRLHVEAAVDFALG